MGFKEIFFNKFNTKLKQNRNKMLRFRKKRKKGKGKKERTRRGKEKTTKELIFYLTTLNHCRDLGFSIEGKSLKDEFKCARKR
jgi:hypothetical protein